MILVKLIGIGNNEDKCNNNDNDDDDNDDNWIIIKNKQVYKSELDYLYDDNENNETEIIEAEEVDTGKIDWNW